MTMPFSASNHFLIEADEGAPTLKRSVSFHTVEVRGYDMTLGSNPSCRSGPAIELGWDFSHEVSDSVDNYESARDPHRRERHEMLLPSTTRQAIILGNGVTLTEMMKVQREARKIRESRRKHAEQSPKQQKRDEMLESTIRTITGWASRKSAEKNNIGNQGGRNFMRRALSMNDMLVSSSSHRVGGGILKKDSSDKLCSHSEHAPRTLHY